VDDLDVVRESKYDPEERLCFGVVGGHERELGYFSLGRAAGDPPIGSPAVDLAA